MIYVWKTWKWKLPYCALYKHPYLCRGMLALLESLWKWRLNTWHCDSSWIHSLGLCNWVTENILPPFQDIEEMFENYGIRVSFDLISLWNFQWCDGTSSIVNKALFFSPPTAAFVEGFDWQAAAGWYRGTAPSAHYIQEKRKNWYSHLQCHHWVHCT